MEASTKSNTSAAQNAEKIAEQRLMELRKRQEEEREAREAEKHSELAETAELAEAESGAEQAEELLLDEVNEFVLPEGELLLDPAVNASVEELDANSLTSTTSVEEVAWLDSTWLSNASETELVSTIELANASTATTTASTATSTAAGSSILTEIAQVFPMILSTGLASPLSVLAVAGAGIGAAVGLSGSSSSAAESAGGTAVKLLTGTAIDGYIKNATVFLDANGNGQLDAGEASTTTDANGNYSLATNDEGNIVVTGGTNTDTGLANKFTLVVDSSASVISPLNAIATALFARRSSDGDNTNDITFEDALNIVRDFFVLSGDMDLASYDYMSESVSESATYSVNVSLALMENHANDKGQNFAESGAEAIDAILSSAAPTSAQDAITSVIAELSGQPAKSGSGNVLSTTAELPTSSGTTTLNDVVNSIASSAAGEDKAAIANILQQNGWTGGAEDANNDGITNAADVADGLVISGTGVPGAIVTLTPKDGVPLQSVTVDDAGNWSYTLTGIGSNGVVEGDQNSASVTQVAEVNGATVTTSLDFDFEVDTQVGRTISFNGPSVVNSSGVNNYTITLAGSETVDIAYEIRDADGNVVQLNNGSGNASGSAEDIASSVTEQAIASSILSNIEDGTYTLAVTITDSAGNTVTGDHSLVLDTNVTGIEIDSYDSLISSTESNTPFAISGSVDTNEIAVGQTITVTFTGTSGGASQQLTATATVQSDGTWETTRALGSFDDGTISMSVTGTDVNGNTGGPAGRTLTLDTTVSNPTVSTDLSGVIESSDLTSDGVLTLAGSLADDDIASVAVYLSGGTPNSATTQVYTNRINATVDGTSWSVNVNPTGFSYFLSSDDTAANIDALGDGEVTLHVVVTDTAGNSVDHEQTFNIELTNSTPTVDASIADLNVQTSSAAGTEFYDLVASNAFADADTSDTSNATLSYSLQMADGSTVPSWLTVTTDGKLAIADGQTAPSTDTTSALVVRVVATDGAGANVHQDVAISVSSGLSLSTNANNVTNLDVRSDLVVTGSENLSLTDQEGTYTITLTDGTASGYESETENNTQTITIAVGSDGSVSSVTTSGDNGTTSKTVSALSDVLTISGS
ncbi:MAG: hypothetical protein KTR23_11500, partial [Rhodospirillales bacterium]|nr:hypothetical protein [Rhodospirillales bacterium]